MTLPRQLLIQMSGAPGSGKSTVANLVARSIEALVINHDLLKAFFLENGMPFDQSGKLAYRLDWTLAEDVIKQGRSVIIDSVCNYNEVLDQGTALARKYGYDYRYIECRLDNVDLLDRRLRNRVPLRSQRIDVNQPPPDAKDANHSDDYRSLFEKWINPRRPATHAITVDSTGRPDDCLNYILQQIVSPNRVYASNSAF